MTPCLSPETITRYRDGTLDLANEMPAVEAHLVGCAACRDALKQAARSADRALAHTLAPDPNDSTCLDEELILRYLDGTTDAVDTECVEAHIADCRLCAEEIKAERAFRTQMQGYNWEAAHAVASAYTWQARLRAWLGRGYRPALTYAAGGALACALLVLLFVRTIQRQNQARVTGLQSQLEQLQESRNALASRFQHSEDESRRMVIDAPKMLAQVTKLQQQAEQLRKQNAILKKKVNAKPVSSLPNQQYALNDGSAALALGLDGTLVRAQKLPTTVAEALKSERLRVPSTLTMLSGRAATLMGNAEETTFALHSPLHTFVLSQRPTFRWQPQPGATGYMVTIVDVAADTEIESGPLPSGKPGAEMQWTLPESKPPLQRGKLYRWYVVATLSDGRTVQSPNRSAVPAKFKVLDEVTAKSILRAQQTYAGSPLTLGVLYAQAGLLDDAQTQLRAFLASNPKSAVARKLLKNVQASGIREY